MAKGQKGQLVTKKHLARQERERRQTRIILIISIAVIVIVVGLITYGVIQQYIINKFCMGRDLNSCNLYFFLLNKVIGMLKWN